MEQKLLFTASTYQHIVRFHLPYIHAFRQQGWRVDVACGGKPEAIDEADRVIHVPFEKQMASPKNISAAWTLRHELERERYNVISTHTALAAFFTRIAAMTIPDRPIIIHTVHGYLFDDSTPQTKRSILLGAERLTAKVTDLLLTMNHWDEEAAKRYQLGKQIIPIPGIGVQFDRFSGLEKEQGQLIRGAFGLNDNRFLLVYAAEFSKRKSQSVLIRALTQLPDRVGLLLPGDGALFQECRQLAQELGVSHRVAFPGLVHNMSSWYAAADGAVSSSSSEGLPFNIMEAMYLGLPVVASAVKGHVDLIEENVSGLLYPYGDVSACAAQIRRLLEAPKLCQRLAQSAAHRVEQYRLDAVLPQVLQAYSQVIPAPEKEQITV